MLSSALFKWLLNTGVVEHNHLSQNPAPVFDYLQSKQLYPNGQSETPLVQLCAIKVPRSPCTIKEMHMHAVLPHLRMK